METNILMKTYDLVDEIKSTKDYKRLIELDNILKTNTEMIELIESFNKAN